MDTMLYLKFLKISCDLPAEMVLGDFWRAPMTS